MKGALADFEVKQLQIMLNKPVYRLIDQRTDFFPRHDLPLLMANRDREKPHGSPSHTTGHTGHVSGGSMK